MFIDVEKYQKIASDVLIRKGDTLPGITSFHERSLLEEQGTTTPFHRFAAANMPVIPFIQEFSTIAKTNFPLSYHAHGIESSFHFLSPYLQAPIQNVRPVDIAAICLSDRTYHDLVVKLNTPLTPLSSEMPHPIKNIIDNFSHMESRKEGLFPDLEAKAAGDKAVKMLGDSKNDLTAPIAIEGSMGSLIDGIGQLAEFNEPLAGMFLLEFSRVWQQIHPQDGNSFWYPEDRKQGILENFMDEGKQATVKTLQDHANPGEIPFSLPVKNEERQLLAHTGREKDL